MLAGFVLGVSHYPPGGAANAREVIYYGIHLPFASPVIASVNIGGSNIISGHSNNILSVRPALQRFCYVQVEQCRAVMFSGREDWFAPTNDDNIMGVHTRKFKAKAVLPIIS